MEAIRCHSPLCEDLIVEILLRLPVKSLLRFKSVCQRWHTIIRCPSFIHNHFHREGNSTVLLVYCDGVVCSPKNCDNAFSLFRDEKLERHEVADHRELLGPIFGMHGPCNGLFCVIRSDNTLALWNPATRKLRPVPHCPFQSWFGIQFGFGIDLLTGDLKIVLISGLCRKPNFAIYNLIDNSWRLLEEEALVDADACLELNYFGPTFSNGFCYWMKLKFRTSHHFVILEFDMHNELFQEIEIPEIIFQSNMKEKLHWYGDSLALLTYNGFVGEGSFDIWSMKEHGCWTKISSVSDPFGTFNYVGIWKRNQIFAVTSDRKLVIYDIDSRNTRNLEFRRVKNPYTDVVFPFPYKESHVPL